MRLLFVDETDRQATTENPDFFCICGLSIDGDVIEVCRELEKIKSDYNLSSLKDSRKTRLDESVRLEIAEKIKESLVKHEAHIIGIILGSDSLSSKLPKEDIYMGAMQFLMERFTLFLTKTENKELGLVIFDCIGEKIERKLRKRFYEYINSREVTMMGTHKAFFKDYIYPSILFADDDQNILIQAVDLIAVSLNSAVANTTTIGSPINFLKLQTGNKFLSIYLPLFAKSPKGEVEGWGIKIWN